MEGCCNLELGLRLRPHDDRDQVAPFTMIYNGEVCICKNVSEAQANEILLLARRGAAEGKQWETRTMGVDWLSLSLDPPPMPHPPSTSAMSMKKSLQKFLEKRKLRMQRSHASPY